MEVTGSEASRSVVKLTFSTLKSLKAFAAFDAPSTSEQPETETPSHLNSNSGTNSGDWAQSSRQPGINFSYTINLNLPATSDQAVFNAIFKSLREHLLSNVES